MRKKGLSTGKCPPRWKTVRKRASPCLTQCAKLSLAAEISRRLAGKAGTGFHEPATASPRYGQPGKQTKYKQSLAAIKRQSWATIKRQSCATIKRQRCATIKRQSLATIKRQSVATIKIQSWATIKDNAGQQYKDKAVQQ